MGSGNMVGLQEIVLGRLRDNTKVGNTTKGKQYLDWIMKTYPREN
jgi:hypothetical protein